MDGGRGELRRVRPAPPRVHGLIVHDLQREGTDYAMVTRVAEQHGTVILSSLYESAIALTRIPT